MKQIIGFTNKYYTLWEASDPYVYWTSKESSVERIDFSYIKNLSMDFDEAKAKVYGDYELDLELRGNGNFSRTINDEANPDEFSFGMLHGEKICEADNLWQLERAMKDEDTDERKKLAYNRLLELNMDVVEHEGNYMTRKFRDELVEGLIRSKRMINSDHIGEIGDSYEGDVLVTETFSFEGHYGTSYCFKMIDEDDNLLVAFTTSKYFVGYWEEGKEGKDGIYDDGYEVEGVNAGDKIRISGGIKKHSEREEEIRLENGNYGKAAIKSTQIVRIKKQGA